MASFIFLPPQKCGSQELFEKGVGLVKESQKILSEAEQKVQQLMQKNDQTS
jgi:exonuclease VII small subunit